MWLYLYNVLKSSIAVTHTSCRWGDALKLVRSSAIVLGTLCVTEERSLRQWQ